MTSRRTLSLKRSTAFLAVSLVGATAFMVAMQARPSLRFDLGSMDLDYLEDAQQFYSRARMDGPIRHADGTVEVIEFYGRLSSTRAGFTLPYHALRSPIQLRIRCHRFGLEGTVGLTVNDHHIGDFVFAKSSYPWAGIQAVIPQAVAESGPLRIRLEVRDGEPPRDYFPEDFGVGVDWIEVEPLSKGARLLPSATQFFFAMLVPILAAAFVLGTGGSFRVSMVVLTTGYVLVALFTAAAPHISGMAWSRLWVVPILGYLLYLLLGSLFTERLEPRLDGCDRAFLSRLFVVALLAHSVLIFFPNHAPPDLWNHIPQIEWLDTLELTLDNVYRYSTSSDVFDDGHVRPHFGTEYGAPYPPFFYMLSFAVSPVHDDPRFLVEFLPVAFGALMMVLVFLVATAIWRDALVARLAAILMMMEIALWHHAHRVHAPGIFGELLMMSWILFLAVRSRALATPRGLALFAALSAATALSYTATLVQLCMFAALLALLMMVWGDDEEKMLAKRLVGGFGVGVMASFVIYYGPYALDAIARREVLLDRVEYDPPATFYFLRNQMRDTVRILTNGYPLYVVLSFAGWLLLRRSGAARFHQRLLFAAGLTYFLMLVLKDPVFLPWIFLHGKEDLFYAPIACLLSALALAWLWRRSAGARAVAIGLLLLMAGLEVRDQYLNVDTLHDQPIAHEAEESEGVAFHRSPTP